MLAAILILFTIPWLDFSKIRSIAFRPFMKLFYWFFIINFFLLLWIGAKPVEEPFISIGFYTTMFYFSYFIIFVPMISYIENTITQLR